MGSKWELSKTVRQQAARLVEVERAMWLHRLSGREAALCTLATLEQALDRGWPARPRPRARLARLIAALERRLKTSRFGGERWQAIARALAALVVSQGRARAVRLGDVADLAIGAGQHAGGAARALLDGARARRRALKQDVVAALMPLAVQAASLSALVSGARIEELVNVAVAALVRAVDEIDPELSEDYQGAVLRYVDRAVARFLESVPHAPEPVLALSTSGGY